MSFWRYIQRVYALDTLDPRLSSTSKTPPTVSGEVPQTKEKRDVAGNANASLWDTPEYYVYYVVFLTIVPLMFYVPFSVSTTSNPQYERFERLLSPGWIPGRRVDNSDQQYASFRDNIPAMAAVVVLHPVLRVLYNSGFEYLSQISSDMTSNQGDYRMRMRISFDISFAAIFLFVLHGFSAFKVLIILAFNFQLGKRLPRSAVPSATWIFNMLILFANELCHGYPYARLGQALLPAPFANAETSWGAWLDSYGGLIPRWEILFNITVLRLISFNLDYYWSLDHSRESVVEKKQLDPALLSERDRVALPAAPSDFNFAYYLAYVLYSPLYLAGPIINFNDYMAQVRFRPTSITSSRTGAYAVRFLLCLLCMELILHYIYAVAISKGSPDWSQYTPFQLSMLGFFNLHIIWLKLLLPWRFFRLWALLDGIDPPENMVRCMSNNYSALAFWRGWHRSYNRFVVRYIYVPLGGSGRQTSTIRSILNMLGVFTFVALWHDISARLLTWSWLIILFILPEMLCKTVLLPAKKFKSRPTAYRILGGIGAVGNILMMMAANLVGFALGLDGLESMLKSIVSGWQGWMFLGSASTVLFVGAMVMFEWREDEKRRGIDLKY
ncbi:MAG: hypothetical protein Q9159_005188 [Coniocarpon cinnabarinum]